MNLDDLKATWQAYDEELSAHHRLTEQLVRSMIRERSQGTLAGITRKLRLVAVIFTALLVFSSAVILGNAFDYTYWLEYLPMLVYLLLSVLVLYMVIGEHQALQAVNLTNANLRENLQGVIAIHQRASRAMGKVWKVCMLAGWLVGVSLTWRQLDHYGWGKTTLLMGLQAGFLLGLYGLATRLFNAFEDPHTAALQRHLRELEEGLEA